MDLWVEPDGRPVKKKRVTHLGPVRYAVPEMAQVREQAKAEHPGNAAAQYGAFESIAADVMRRWGANDMTYGMPRDAAIAWTKAHSSQIKVCSARYRRMLTCFTEEDFASEAVVSALEATDIANRKGEPFEGIFWLGYKYRLERLCRGPQIGRPYFEDEDGNREDNRLGSMDMAPDIQLEKAGREMFHAGPQCKSLINQATGIMSAEESEAWMLYMSDSRPTTQEVGDRMELTRQGAEYRIKRGWRRVQQFYCDLGITGDADTGDITSGHRLLVGVEIEDVEICHTAEQASARKRRARIAKAMPAAGSFASAALQAPQDALSKHPLKRGRTTGA